MSGLKSQALWLLFSNFFSAILQIIQISVLARHLELHELGVLAIVNSILMIAMILQDMGMSSYIVHKQSLTRNEQSTIYWVNFLLSLFAGLLVFICALPLAKFYAMQNLAPLVMLASINFLFLGSLSQYQAHYIKSKKMVLLAKIEMTAKTISFLCVIFFIFYTDLRTSAVILGLIINAVCRLILMSLLGDKDWRPLFYFDKGLCKDVFKYGVYQLGSQIINQLRTQLDVIIIGKVLGSDSLGLYSLAKDLIMQPLKLITPVINRLALPRFAEAQNNSDILKSVYLKGTAVIVLFSAFSFIFIYIFSPTIITLLYGSERMTILSLLPFMLLFGMLRPMGGLTGAIAQANGRTNVEFYWNVIAGIMVVCVSLTILIYSSLWYVSLVLSLSQILITFMVFPFFVKPIVNVKFSSYILNWLPATITFTIIVYLIYNFNLFVFPFW
ncbi:TPA: lipopolysaccharide biosynthesis protein [Klebsiella quasipneumoniae subsp. quasipneumoniae]|uniref:O-antigen flippase n=1 Tax=Klebsiella sp. 1461 TaxID=1339201 RepID=W0S9M0_9ENTR|nr:lipopolysaccharide biosynthesis protein [Klebsiella quasipneumoniae]BAO27562.1 O-antigen flippase [Klebsiella sp. 1461]HBR1595863.1 lipopolysaccharide biosynthesis protein [Klebsiella quasipneumoniae subsp. quasipneumoniae]EIY5092485.1 lipopolysaccharide biosynthesis protein [Klebsiella quasipneumoniae]EIY5132578.1 lipopolysaccharide biosynthesis protein [Klebsiella quasipneumoniae]MCZ0712035.1 lipopolysaccharide biosynthesis protein [Klebsiella quasipneumoniae]